MCVLYLFTYRGEVQVQQNLQIISLFLACMAMNIFFQTVGLPQVSVEIVTSGFTNLL